MNATAREQIMQRWNVIQDELIPQLWDELGVLTPKLERVIYTLEWVRIEEFVASSWCGIGRRPHERAWLANAFVAKNVLQITTTVGLIERLTVDRALRRICGFSLCEKLPSEATFSRAFEEFAKSKLPELVHEALIKEASQPRWHCHRCARTSFAHRDGGCCRQPGRPVDAAAAPGQEGRCAHC